VLSEKFLRNFDFSLTLQNKHYLVFTLPRLFIFYNDNCDVYIN